MKYYNLIFLLVSIPLFLSASGHNVRDSYDRRNNNLATSGRFGDSARYEVRFTFTGYTSLYGGPPDCPVGRNGKVVLSGSLAGVENVNSDDDILYTGILHLEITKMDICSAMRLSNGEDQLCRTTVSGAGPMEVELELYFNGMGQDSARGGYIKMEYNPTLGIFWKLVGGTCDTQQLNEEKDMVPNKTIASIFNGCELPMLTTRTLRVGRYVTVGEGGEIVVEVLRVVQR